ncbi:hypothetical protein AAZX31_14G104600 [Glycine max]|nr:hypothetical protein GLYMA_14G106150v4 [Glycine max]KAH1093988.1 hypothetical protein GYH30_039637 [Glycine max]
MMSIQKLESTCAVASKVCKKLGEEGARDIYTGEILSFSQKGPRGICILSANGAISNVTIRQPGSSGGILTYEGWFEILSLSKSFTVADNSGMKSRTGGLNVRLTCMVLMVR